MYEKQSSGHTSGNPGISTTMKRHATMHSIPALEFCWAHSGAYATRDGNGKITVFQDSPASRGVFLLQAWVICKGQDGQDLPQDFKESFSFKPPFTVEETYGGRRRGAWK